MSSVELLHREAVKLLRGDPCCEALIWAANEIKRLSKIEIAARTYYRGYVQDEARSQDCCIIERQHLEAKALRDALRE